MNAFVVSSGSVSGLSILGSDTLIIFSGATAVASLDDGGAETVFSGGVSSESIIEGSGSQVVSAGGSAVLLTISSGGIATDYGSELGATVEIDATLTVAAGGVASNTTVSFGQQVVQGGAAYGAIIDQGSDWVTAGGVDHGATILLSALQSVGSSGEAIDTTVDSGGYQQAQSGGIVSATTISADGTLILSSGGTAFSATVLSGGRLLDAGGIANATNLAGGALAAFSAGSALNTQVGAGAAEMTSAGGVSISGLIASGGAERVESGGTAAFTTVAYGGLLSVVDGGSAVGALIQSGGRIQVSSGGLVTSTTLVSAGATVQLDIEADMGTVFGYSAADFLAVSGESYSSGDVAALLPGNLLLISQTDGSSETLQFDPGQSFAGDMFDVVADPNNANVLDILEQTACFCAGTHILTAAGFRQVETLRPGDLVRTVGGGCEPIRWIGRRSYRGRAFAGRRHLLPIRIREGALNDATPRADLLVSPLHAMLLDGFLIPAWLLLNGTTIVQEAVATELHYFHIELPYHAAIWAEGAATESYFDDENRALFENAGDLCDQEHSVKACYCAPRIDEGPALEAIRRRLSTPRVLAAFG